MEEHTNLLSKIHSSNMVQTDWIILRDIYVCECSNNYWEKGHVFEKSKKGDYRMVWREERDRINDIIILYSQIIKNNIEEKFKSNNFVFENFIQEPCIFINPASLSTRSNYFHVLAKFIISSSIIVIHLYIYM